MSQDVFAAALLDPDQPVPPGLVDPQGRPAGSRFDVYRNNVLVSLTDALELSFPVIARLVGADFFRAMAREFARLHPPETPMLAFYGAAMPEFLQGFPPVAHLGYLPDVARLEHAIRASYHAADSARIAPEAISAMPTEHLMEARLMLSPALRLIRSDWPVHSIWRANMEDGPMPTMRAEDVLIARPDFDPRLWLLPAGGADFVSALASDQRFGNAVLAAGSGFDLTTTLRILLDARAFVAVREATADATDSKYV
jgi:hypothetical protein